MRTFFQVSFVVSCRNPREGELQADEMGNTNLKRRSLRTPSSRLRPEATKRKVFLPPSPGLTRVVVSLIYYKAASVVGVLNKSRL